MRTWGSHKTSEVHTPASTGFDLYWITVLSPRELGEAQPETSALERALAALVTRPFPTPTLSEEEALVLGLETGVAQTDVETEVDRSNDFRVLGKEKESIY